MPYVVAHGKITTYGIGEDQLQFDNSSERDSYLIGKHPGYFKVRYASGYGVNLVLKSYVNDLKCRPPVV